MSEKTVDLKGLFTAQNIGNFFKKYTMIVALVLVIVFFYFTTGGAILNPGSINSLIFQNAYVFVLASGMLLCILTGGNIDLSVGSVVAFSAAVGARIMADSAKTMNETSAMILAVLAMLGIGLLVGAFQGFFIAWIKVPPFIATLAGMNAFKGLTNLVLDAKTLDITNEQFKYAFYGEPGYGYIRDVVGSDPQFNLFSVLLGIAVAVIIALMTWRKIAAQKKLGILHSMGLEIVRPAIIALLIVWLFWKLASNNGNGIPNALVLVALVLFIYHYVTNRTAFGRHLYAVGGNEKATRLSGVNTRLVYFLAYVNMGMLAGMTGILAVARNKGADPNLGKGYEMDAIAACFIGGASAYGGSGKISGMIIGALLIGVINQGMDMKGVTAAYKSVVKGLVLLTAVLFDVLSKREKK